MVLPGGRGVLSLPGILRPQVWTVNHRTFRTEGTMETEADGTLVVDTHQCLRQHETSSSVSASSKRLNFLPVHGDGGSEPEGY